jgi:general secretion pathway protein D
MEFPSGTESSMRVPAVRGPIEALGVELPDAPAVVVTPTPISGRP